MTAYDLLFRPGVATRVEVDDRNLLFCAVHRKTGQVPDQRQVILDGLAHPIGAERLEDLVRPGQSVVILFDDITRPTPAAAILPPILDALRRAGIRDADIRLFAALGTHRPMTDAELRAKLGADAVGRYKIINREYLDGDFVSLGTTPSGIPIEVDRAVMEADVKIAVGNVVPHITAGWGGGSKILLPGACSRITTDMMHYVGCIIQPVLEVLGVRDTRPRAEMDAIARRVGLDFIVNTVLDEEGHLLGVFAGDVVEAHRRAVALAEQVMVIPIPRQADILIVSANPCHVDYWQGLKPYAYAHLAVREGGIIIFMLDGAEHLCGDAPSHEPTLHKYMRRPFDELVAAVERGEVDDLVGLNLPLYHAVLYPRVQKTICVTNHLTPGDLEVLGFDSAPTVQAALEQAYGVLGRDAKVGVIPFGGETLTRVGPAIG
ncbi:MAG: nickel-dependent lactate racemase [Anaerolineae bacterium]|nr:nickel-dependent lactate racemase [Anaerolineae bacterium]